MSIISCKHPKFSTTLWVTNKPRGKEKLQFSGNPNNALDMPHGTAQLVRDDVLEHKLDAVIHRS